MWKIPDSSVIIITFMGMMTLSAGQSADSDTVGADFDELKTESGDVYLNVLVKRVESSALVIRHRGGIARVSLFNLSPSIQAKYNFDPVAAMKSDEMRSAEENDRQQTLMLENRKREAELEKARAKSNLILLAKTDWVPVEATVVKRDNGRTILSAKRITLVPTRIRSTLGFLKDGPPEKVLEPFTPELLLLNEVAASENSGALNVGDIWRGYLNPVPDNHRTDLKTGVPHLPVHQGVARTP